MSETEERVSRLEAKVAALAEVLAEMGMIATALEEALRVSFAASGADPIAVRREAGKRVSHIAPHIRSDGLSPADMVDAALDRVFRGQ